MIRPIDKNRIFSQIAGRFTNRTEYGVITDKLWNNAIQTEDLRVSLIILILNIHL